MAEKYKTIGVICIGPEATTNLYMRIIKLFQKKFHSVYDNEFPEFITRGIPLPDVVHHGLDDSEIEEMMVKAVKQLKQAGADFVVIPCNTVHKYVSSVSKKDKIPILSIIDETIRIIKRKKAKKVLVLGTINTLNSNIYSDPLKKEGIKAMKPSAEYQKIVDKVITDGFMGKKTKKDHMKLVKVIDHYKDKVDGVLLGCTELPLLISQKDVDIDVFDTLEILAHAAFHNAIN